MRAALAAILAKTATHRAYWKSMLRMLNSLGTCNHIKEGRYGK